MTTHPSTLTPGPAYLLVLLGGVIGVVLLGAFLFLAPTFGFPYLDIPRLVGGVFTEDANGAFWTGYIVFSLIGVVVFPPLLVMAWPLLPGRDERWWGASAKGLSFGGLLWILGGVGLPILGWVNQLADQDFEGPGLFALGAGLLGALGFLLGHLAYGLTVALVGEMGQSINPVDTLGWKGYRPGLTPMRHPGYQEKPTW